MPPSKPRRLGAVAKRSSPIKLYACPMCAVRMSMPILDAHVDQCKGRRSLQTRVAAPAIAATGTAAPASAGSSVLHFCFRWSGGLPCCMLGEAQCCVDGVRGDFGDVVALRGYGNSKRVLMRLHALYPVGRVALRVPSGVPGACRAAKMSPSLLKSALQKCVRRGRPGPAVRVAVTLMLKTSLFELLRRLTVIFLEDAILYPQFDVLVWLLAATGKGYTPSRDDVIFVLRAVYSAANVRVKDMGATCDAHTASQSADNERAVRLVESLRVRVCYGGMGGDVAMFRDGAFRWGERFDRDAEQWLLALDAAYAAADAGFDGAAAVGAVGERQILRVGDVAFAAVDFHCSTISDEIAREILGGVAPGVLERFGVGGFDGVKGGVEKLMWLFRSSVNSKRIWGGLDADSDVAGVTQADEVLWREELAGPVHRWTRDYLRRFEP